ncbi:MAG: putative lipid II flippase FtsW [Candidatus Omnitrophica bacterium]|nr:putative lipid II flippase FtsW [Candidatus Omnitrophota bacterium]
MFLREKYINYKFKAVNIRRSILGMVIFLTLFGLLMVYDVSSIYAWQKYADAMYFLKRQIVSVVIGLMFMFVAMAVDLDYLKRHSRHLVILGVILLLCTFIPYLSRSAGGARRWIHVGMFNFQPSELVKVFFIIYCADYFSRKKSLRYNFRKGVLPLLLVTAALSFLILMEPDLGNAFFISFLALILIFVWGASRKKLTSLFAVLFFLTLILVLISPYRRARLAVYFNPWLDAKGKGFQIVQSQIAIGSGGILGAGLGKGEQKLFFLPAAHTDFIFSIIAEELGLGGALVILLSFFWIFLQSFRLLRELEEGFSFYLGLGAVLTIILEVLINITVALGIFPAKGLPLPFISYGGTAVVINFVLLGLFFNASNRIVAS